MAKYFKYRGVDNLVFARVTQDDAEKFETGEVKPLAPVARVGKTVESSSATEFFDNVPMFVVNSEGADEIELEATAIPLEVLAELIGKSYDDTTGAMIDGEREERYFAIGYRTKGTDGKYHYIWRLKGVFAIPDEENATEDDGTDTTGTTLTYTGIHTVHKFTKGKYDSETSTWSKGTAKGVVVDERKGLADVSTFFDAVVTPDTITKKGA